MRAVAVLPARMGSSRFPGKPLAPILGRSMIEHCYRRVALSDAVEEVVVATCDEEIVRAVEAFGGRAIMTSDQHERASDRVAEAAGSIDADVYVMVQGDEPMTTPQMIDEALAPFAEGREGVGCVNLLGTIEDEAEFRSPNTIKVIVDTELRALYMSREPIPTTANLPFERITAYRQVCIIPFTRDALAEFAALPPTPVEIAESIDMMRFLEHGRPVHMVPTAAAGTRPVDTPDDLAAVEELMREDPLLARYA